MEKKTSGVKKVLNIILNIVIWVFVAFAVVITVLAFAAQSSKNGIPSLGGKSILTVQSDSMSPTFKKGDIIISNKLTEEETKDLKVGDVISYQVDLNGDGTVEVNTHRIVQVFNNDDGSVTFQTQGDNKETNQVADSYIVTSTMIIGTYSGTKLQGMGTALDFLQTPKGFLVVIVIPLMLFFIFELVNFIKKVLEVKKDGKKEISAADEELIKQKAVEEYLRQQAEKESVEAKQEEATEAGAGEAVTAEETAETESKDEGTIAEEPTEEVVEEESKKDEAEAE